MALNLTYPVTTIDHMYHACNPDKPLESAQDSRYQDLSRVRGQGKGWIHNIAQKIERDQQVGDVFSMLFSGHRGSGKTTELHQLRRELENQGFFVVYLDIDNVLDMNDVEYQDVLLSITDKLYAEMEVQGWRLNEKLLRNLSDWFAEKIVVTEKVTAFDAELSSEAEGGLKTFFGGLADPAQNLPQN